MKNLFKDLLKCLESSYLCIRFPFLRYEHETLFFPRYNKLGELEKGWRKAFGIQMCKEIKRSLKVGRKNVPFYILYIKEKYGSMRLEYSGGTTETQKIIYKYEYISEHTCCICGKTATVQTNGYILPLCDDCVKDHTGTYTDFGLIGFYGVKGNINNRKNWKQLEEQYKEYRERYF